jgi:ParB family transcriptional regulator, chromosome partitioning protein
MAEKRRGLGRGLGALIPTAPTGEARPVDVFFPDSSGAAADTRSSVATMAAPEGLSGDGEAAASPDLATTADLTTFDEEVDEILARSEERTRLSHVSEEAVAERPTGEPGQVSGTASTSTSASTAADGDALVPVPGARFAELPVDSITPNPRQPRTVFEQDALAELVASIREIGVLQPVVVRPVVTRGDDGSAEYELIMGERRWRATQQAGLATIPAIVRETDDSALLRDALLENLHRSDLNPLEEAAAYQQLLDDFGCTHEELAQRIHRSRPQISNMLRLLRLPPTVQRRVAAGVLSAGHARALLGLADSAAMERLAQRIVAEGLSVRTTEEIVALGGEPDRTRRRTRTGEKNEALEGLAARLSDRFETRVRIELGKSKGRITVEFASVEDLHRILETLSPEDAAVTS